MNKVRFSLKTFVFLALTLACASVARAQATRTWVSGVGDDVNLCSRTAPCKTFAGAISKTADGGGTGLSGIRFVSVRELNIENCAIFGFKGNGTASHGIEISLSFAANQRAHLTDIIIRDNTRYHYS